MAKRTSQKAKQAVQETTAIVASNDETTAFAEQLRLEFYQAKNKQPLLDSAAMIELVKANATDQVMAKEWWIAKIVEAEDLEAMRRTTGGRRTPETLADVLNADTATLETMAKIGPAQELPPKAPAMFAIALENDFSADQLADFAEPWSRQKDGTDMDKLPVGDNRKGSIIWDYVDMKAANTGEPIKFQWYRRFIDRTKIGARYNEVLTKLSKITEKGTGPLMVSLDGETHVNLKEMPQSEHDKIKGQYNQRINRLCEAYRKAYAIILQTKLIRDTMGDRVGVDYVWQDPANPTKGLTLGLAPIRIKFKNPKGEYIGTQTDFTVTEYLNLDVNKAIDDKGVYQYAKLIDSQKEKVKPVTAGSKEAKAKRALEEAARVSAERIPQWFEKMYEWIEKDGNHSALVQQLHKLPKDKLRMFRFHVVKVQEYIDKKLVTDQTLSDAKDVEREIIEAANKELDEKAKG